MPEQSELASQIRIKIDGTEAQPDVMANVVSVEVDQHAHLPGMFVIRVQDPDFELIDRGPFDLTKEIEISAQTAGGEWSDLIKGEITALEPEFQEGMIARLAVRGYDKSHRLYRETKSQAHLNKKDSDLATEIAQGAGLQADVESTSTVYDHIFQHNQTDLEFLKQRAWRIGYECYVDDGKLIFHKPSARESAATLTWGDNLLSFYPRMNLAEQVDEVVVRGWSVDEKKAVVGRAQQGALYPQIQESQDGASWASAFGSGKQIIVDQNVSSQAEANTLAAARLDEISGAFVQAEGEALRRPDIRAGKAVALEGLGERFSGTYLVTSARHAYTPEGLKTTFSVKGTRTGLLLEAMRGRNVAAQYPGVVPAVVTNADDPQNLGRVKLQFPWMSEDAESNWTRVVGAGAGPDAGFLIVPEVGDEVLVAFEQGSFNRPYVLGGLWNGQQALPPTAASGNEKPLVRSWHSRTGHHITVYDNADNKIEIITSGGQMLVLDDANQRITITSSSGMTLTFDDGGGKFSIEGNQIEIKASGSLKIEAGANIDLQAGGQVNVTGAMINLN
ncbi:MAG: VgrG-related protein [Actinobacteria bacterium]|nr:VgrG-related protein [Actinomycetota bacterium]